MIAASAEASVVLYAGVADLAGKTLGAQVRLTLCEDATAYAVAQIDHDEVLHTMGTAKDILAQGPYMGIVAQCHCQAQTVLQHGSQRNLSLPGQIGGILNASRQEIGTGRADSHRTDALIATVVLYHFYDLLTQVSDEIVDIDKIGRCKGILGNNVTSDIDNSINRFIYAQSYSHHPGFNCTLYHSYWFLMRQK